MAKPTKMVQLALLHEHLTIIKKKEKNNTTSSVPTVGWTHKKIRDQNQFLYDATLTGINLNTTDPNSPCHTYSNSKHPCDSHQYHTTLLAH